MQQNVPVTDPIVIMQIAAAASADVRTVRRYFANAALRPLVRGRIERAIEQLDNHAVTRAG